MKVLLLIFTILSIVSCTKVEPLSPQEDQVQIDWNTELKKSEWIYHLLQLGVNEKWKFLNDSNIQSEIVRDGDTTIIIHTYRIIKDSFILMRPNYGSIGGLSNIYAVVWANLKLSNDTVFWRYHNMTEHKKFLIKNK
jgi:hypothetical protein